LQLAVMEPAWTSNWAWGLPLVAVTLAVHGFGVMTIALAMSGLGDLPEARAWPTPNTLLFGAAVIGAVGCALAALHGLEAAIWAVAYIWLGALGSLADAIFFSVDSITTRGESGLVLERHWQMMGALEAANGVLLFGISTAFLFVVVERAWQAVDKTVIRRRAMQS
jgi:hypothetical protein